MSDRMSNVEIEDVISSIRKLVDKSDPGGAQPAEAASKLVLEPSQLVEESPAPQPVPEPDVAADASAKTDGPLKLGEAIKPKKVKKAEEAAPAPQDAEKPSEADVLEAELSENAPEDEVLDDPVIDGQAELLDEWEPAEGLPGAAFGGIDPDIEDADLAEVEDSAPPKAEVLMFSHAAARSKAKAAEAKAAEEAKKKAAAEAEAAKAASEVEAEASDAEPAEESVAAEAEETQAVAPEVETETGEAAQETPDVAESRDDLEDELLAAELSEDGTDADENSEDLDVDDLPLNEDALRAMVATVIREELKGALGERITRNVRKMVRREIANALSGLDID